MALTKVAITIDQLLLDQVDELVAAEFFPNRSKAIQAAIRAQLAVLRHERLARESAKLSIRDEQGLADEALSLELSEWPEY